jgi:hypothetical protein
VTSGMRAVRWNPVDPADFHTVELGVADVLGRG